MADPPKDRDGMTNEQRALIIFTVVWNTASQYMGQQISDVLLDKIRKSVDAATAPYMPFYYRSGHLITGWSVNIYGPRTLKIDPILTDTQEQKIRTDKIIANLEHLMKEAVNNEKS